MPFPHEVIPPPPWWHDTLEGSKKKKKKKPGIVQTAAAAAARLAEESEEEGEETGSGPTVVQVARAPVFTGGLPMPPRIIRSLAAWAGLAVLGWTIFKWFRKKKGGRR